MPITATPYTAVYFNPQSVSGCCIWLDAADPVSFNSGGITNGTTITTWNDKSGVGQSITVAGTPVWNSTTLNSSPSVNLTNGRFSGVFTNTLSNFTFTAFIITSLNSYPTGGYPCLAFQNTPSGSFLRVLDYAGAFRYLSFLTGGFGLSTTASLTTPFLWSTTYNGSTSAYLYYNGSNTANSTAASSPGCNAAYFYLGTEPGDIPGVNSWPGYVSEVVVYNSVLTQTARQQVEGYLAQKWGLTSQLPAGHPGLTQTIYTSNYNYKFYQSRVPLSPPSVNPYFNPRQLTGVTCALWMDGADSSTFSLSGTTVTQWRDKSGLGYNSTVIGGAPALTANAINGLPAISFNGSSYISGCNANTTATGTYFIIATLASGQGAGQQYTSAFVFGRSVGGGSACYNEVQSINLLACANVAPSLALSPQRNNAGGPSYTLSNYNTAFMHTTVCNGTTMAGYGNGTSLGTIASSGNFAYTLYSIGSQTYSYASVFYNYNWTGYIGEVIAFNNALSDPQRQQVEGYLAWKWGLQASLPSNHPYLNVPPGVPWESSLTRGLTRLPAIIATGGTIVTANGFRTHTFTTVGTTNFVVSQAVNEGVSVQVLIVAGGGSGSGDRAAGGGAGGLIFTTTSVRQGTYPAIVGAGGTVGTGNVHGTDGSNSSFNGQVAIGGGSGGSHFQGAYIGSTGGSGGGGAAPGPGTPSAAGGSGTVGQGYGGGTGFYSNPNGSAGGGGGAGGLGTNGIAYFGGNGGPGLSITIGGVTGYYAAGGGGSAAQDFGAAVGGKGGSTVNWLPIINVPSYCTLTGTGPYTYFKSGGTGGTYDTAVYSTYGFTTNILLSFSVYTVGGSNNKMIGFSTNQLAGADYNNIQYGFYLDAGSNIYSDEGGTLTNIGTTYTTSTVFVLTYDGTNIKYYNDGTVLRTVAVSSGPTYYLNSGMAQTGNGFQNVYFGGGGNADQTSTTAATPGIANTGSGGAGAGNSTWNTNATNGGSGIVIISYPYP